jgi:hypothetical protein
VSLDFIIERLTSAQVGGRAAQVIIYALVIYLGLVIISKITDKRERRARDEGGRFIRWERL